MAPRIVGLQAAVVVVLSLSPGAARAQCPDVLEVTPGGMTLREAVSQANSCPGDQLIRVFGTVSLTDCGPGEENNNLSGDLDLTDTTGDLTVEGGNPGADLEPGPDVIEQTCPGQRIFQTFTYRALTLRNLTLRGGTGDVGGAVHMANGALTTVATQFTDNHASEVGGAIYVLGAESLRVIGGGFTNNTAASAGGAILVNLNPAYPSCESLQNCPRTIFYHTHFTHNAALNADPWNSQGGAVSLSRGSLETEGVTFENNRAPRGGAVATRGSSHLMKNTRFIGNRAEPSSNYPRRGGALHLAFNATGTLEQVEFENNVAEVGGALYLDDSNPGLTVTGGHFRYNRVETHSSTEGPRGGAVYLNDSRLVLQGTDLSGNRTLPATLVSHGAGIYADASHLELKGTTHHGNIAANSGGGAFLVNTSFKLDDVDFVQNSAQDNGGGLFVRGQGLVAEITNSHFFGNEAFNGGALASEQLYLNLSRTTFANNGARAAGGAAFLSSQAGLYATETEWIGNNVWEDIMAPMTGGGGAIAVTSGSLLSLIQSTASYNRASRGGAIWGLLNPWIAVDNSTVVGNSSFGSFIGGTGIALASSGVLMVSRTTIADNLGFGPALRIHEGPLRLFGSYVGGNGGGDCSLNGSVPMNGEPFRYSWDTDGSCQLDPLTSHSLGPVVTFGPLGHYGGYAQTLQLLPGNPLIDYPTYPASACDGFPDERGVVRAKGLGCDIGAVEYDGNPEQPPAGDAAATFGSPALPPQPTGK